MEYMYLGLGISVYVPACTATKQARSSLNVQSVLHQSLLLQPLGPFYRLHDGKQKRRALESRFTLWHWMLPKAKLTAKTRANASTRVMHVLFSYLTKAVSIVSHGQLHAMTSILYFSHRARKDRRNTAQYSVLIPQSISSFPSHLPLPWAPSFFFFRLPKA